MLMTLEHLFLFLSYKPSLFVTPKIVCPGKSEFVSSFSSHWSKCHWNYRWAWKKTEWKTNVHNHPGDSIFYKGLGSKLKFKSLNNKLYNDMWLVRLYKILYMEIAASVLYFYSKSCLVTWLRPKTWKIMLHLHLYCKHSGPSLHFHWFSIPASC